MREPRNSHIAEQVVLGALMLAGPGDDGQRVVESILRTIEPFGPSVFYRPIHGAIFTAIMELRATGRPHGALEVSYHLGAAELHRIGGGPYLHTCISMVPTIENAPVHALALVDEYQLRQVHLTAVRSIQRADGAATNQANAVVETVKREWEALATPGSSDTLQPWGAVAGDTVNMVGRLGNGEGLRDGVPIPTGIADLDQLLGGGFRAGQLIVIAGRPGVGKTVVGGTFAKHVGLDLKLPFAWFSREMSTLEIGQRLLSAGARVLFDKLRTGDLDDEDWTYIAKFLDDTADAPLAVDDSPMITMPHISSALDGYARQHGQLAGFMIDYAQIIDQTPETGRLVREQQISRISGGSKLLTRKHGCFGLLLAQLNRGPEQRADKIPQLSDLRESGTLEQDADVVILLHRPDYYDPESARAGEMDLHVAKHRGGPTDTITVASQLHLQRVASLAM